MFGKSKRNATGPGPVEWCIAGERKRIGLVSEHVYFFSPNDTAPTWLDLTNVPSPSRPSTRAGITADRQCCFVEWCEAEGLTTAADGSPYFAPVTHFVSHAWHASFPQLVETLELYIADGTETGTPAGEEAAWFLDVFAINQHVPPWRENPPMSHGQVLKPAIVNCGRTVLVLHPWEKPKSFTRVWCLFEIMSTLEEGATLDVALSGAERNRFVETLTSCLLYTSPSPRDATLSRMPSSA